jgi:hypothetical protein
MTEITRKTGELANSYLKPTNVFGPKLTHDIRNWAPFINMLDPFGGRQNQFQHAVYQLLVNADLSTNFHAF